MTYRGLTLVVLLLAMGIGGYVFARQAQTVGPTSQLAQEATEEAKAQVAAINFQAAIPAMEAYFSTNTTYAGATLPPSYGVVVARADAVSYCLQDAAGAKHLAGPGGTPQPGAC